MYYVVAALFVINCFVLMFVILLQQGKGGDIASAFGGGSSQAAFGARSGATVLSRATSVCAVLFVIGAIVLGIMGQRGPGSVIGGRAPLAPASAPATPAPAPARHRLLRLRHQRSNTSRSVRLQPDQPSSRKWRNWQTHQLEGLAVAIPWGFESPLPHQPSLMNAGEGCSPSARREGGLVPFQNELRLASHAKVVLRSAQREGGPASNRIHEAFRINAHRSCNIALRTRGAGSRLTEKECPCEP